MFLSSLFPEQVQVLCDSQILSILLAFAFYNLPSMAQLKLHFIHKSPLIVSAQAYVPFAEFILVQAMAP